VQLITVIIRPSFYEELNLNSIMQRSNITFFQTENPLVEI